MSRKEWALLWIGSILFAAAFSWPLFEHMGVSTLYADWNQALAEAWGVRHSIVDLHRFPMTMDWPCANFPLFAHPQSRILSPMILLHLVFGLIVGMHLEIIAHTAVGFTGAYFLARSCGLSKAGATACGLSFAGSTWYPLHLSVGHEMFECFVYVPWILAFVYRGSFWLGGIFIALLVYEGGVVYPLPYTLLTLIIMIPLWRRYESGILAIATGLLWSMPKLVLMFGQFRPRFTAEDTNSLGTVICALFSRQSIDSGIAYPWVEYGAYISFVMATLALIGIAGDLRRCWPWLVLTLILILLSLGNPGPWMYLHKMPLWEQMRMPARFLILATLSIGMLAGYGIDKLNSPKIAIALLLVATIDCWTLAPRYLDQVYHEPVVQEPLTLENFNQFEPNIKCRDLWR